MVTAEVSVVNKAYAMSVENGSAISALVFNLIDYHQADFFACIKHIEDCDIPIIQTSLSLVTSLLKSFRMYVYDYFRSIIFVTFHRWVSSSGMTIL